MLAGFFHVSPPSAVNQTIDSPSTPLRVHIESEPKTLDPAQATGVREFQILQTLFEGLTRYEPRTLKPLPGVAERWEVSPDGLRYVFYLRKDAKWSDGNPVTAADFFNGWERLLNPKTESPYAFQLFYIKGGEDYAEGKLKDPKQLGMKVLSPAVFEVVLERPVPYFLSLTSFSALVPIRKGTENITQITNGPFFFKSLDKTEGLLLEKNPHYWGVKEVRLPSVQFRPFGNFATALIFYGRTGIDIMTDLPPQQVPMLKFRSDFRSAPMLRTEYFVVNCKKPPFDKVEVRRALAYALQRKEIADSVLKRGDLPYGFFVPPGLPNYKSPDRPQDFAPSEAKALLEKAGFDTAAPFPTLAIHFNNEPDRKLVAKAAAQMWKKTLHIDSRLVEEKWDKYLNTRHMKNFDVSWGGWIGDYLDPNTFLELWTSDNRQNHSGWSNAAYDELIRKAQAEQNVAEREKLFRAAEQILLDEAPIIPVLVKVKNYLIHPYIKGYYPNLLDIHPLRDVYSLRP